LPRIASSRRPSPAVRRPKPQRGPFFLSFKSPFQVPLIFSLVVEIPPFPPAFFGQIRAGLGDLPFPNNGFLARYSFRWKSDPFAALFVASPRLLFVDKY